LNYDKVTIRIIPTFSYNYTIASGKDVFITRN